MDIAESIIFYIVTFAAIIGALSVIFSSQIVYAILGAFTTLASVGILFFALELPFLGVVQIAVCAIGISILFVFALMMTRQDKENELWVTFKPRLFLVSLGIILISLLIVLFLRYSIFHPENSIELSSTIIMPSTKVLSIEMFLNYGAPFVFSSLAFLAAILGFGVILSSGGKK